MRAGGLDDFGEDTWQEGLEVLVAVARTTRPRSTRWASRAMTDQIVGYLANRLEVEQWYARAPRDRRRRRSWRRCSASGCPRTGSTALSFLLAQDPARRSLRVWEAADPCPPPETATEHTDPRIAEAQAGIDFTNEMFPGFAGMLPTAADGPQECLLLDGARLPVADLRGHGARPELQPPGCCECDMEPAYRYHRRVLKLLQWRCPPDRWWLKTPAHMLSIDALDAVYPDARFVMTHRDVGKVLPSVCALYDTFSSVLTDRPRPARHRRPQPRAVAHRPRAAHRLPRPRQRGPVPTTCPSKPCSATRSAEVADLYAELGDELTDDARQRMEAWWAESSKDRSGPGTLPGRRRSASTPRRSPTQFAFYYRPLRRPRRLRSTRMDEITQKVVDGTAWREFCDLLADAGEVILAEGNPDDPLDRAEGFRMLTRLLRGALETQARVRPAGAARARSAPATRRSRSSARTRTTTTSARRSTGSTTTGSGARAARRSGSASTCSPAPASAAVGRAPAPRCTRSRCTSSPTAPSR